MKEQLASISTKANSKEMKFEYLDKSIKGPQKEMTIRSKPLNIFPPKMLGEIVLFLPSFSTSSYFWKMYDNHKRGVNLI